MTEARKKAERAACEIVRLNPSLGPLAEMVIADIIERHHAKPAQSKTQHSDLVARWMQSYEELFGFKYAFSAKDGRAVKQMLGHGMSVDEVMELAERAWRLRDSKRHFFCKNSVTLYGLASRLNEIRTEIGAASMSSLTVMPVKPGEKF